MKTDASNIEAVVVNLGNDSDATDPTKVLATGACILSLFDPLGKFRGTVQISLSKYYDYHQPAFQCEVK
jgi:hypothetical protein